MLIKDVPDVTNEFTPQANTLHDFFTSEARGFYIPLYQRPYSWNSENVEQLMEDILKGVEATLSNHLSVSFLGTVILCLEQNKQKNIEPVDHRALPGTVYNVIDGQQRISTIALLATRLYKLTFKFIKSLEGDEYYEEIIDFLEGQLEDLAEFFSLMLKTKAAKPKNKPLVIRGSHDEWTLNGEDSKYTSSLSNYLAQFIRDIENGGIDIPDRRTTLGRNLKTMDYFIDSVFNAHKQSESHITYPDAKRIIKAIDQELIWEYEREEYYQLVTNSNYDDNRCSNVSSAIQLCMFFHYFYERTCLSVILPTSEDWAFDIFQSLNATGTPLTAIETFKPLVVNTVNKQTHTKYKGSKSEENFNLIDALFEKYDTAEKKIKLTKEFLNVFRLVYEGKSLSNHFSQQRKWLNDSYNVQETNQEKDEFVHRLANLAKYWTNVKNFDFSDITTFYGLKEQQDKELCVLCVRYLDEASHRMADTLLSRFYARVLRNVEGADKDFIDVSKSLAAFFTLWRAAFSNTGLDEVYRKLFEQDKENKLPNYSWVNSSTDYSVKDLKKYFRKVLQDKGILEKQHWLDRSTKNLRYDTAKTICKFTLFVTAHDTIPDPKQTGLMKKGTTGVNPYLDVKNFLSSDLRTIEHVAPQSNDDSGWDAEIYSKQMEHQIGNLTLLPLVINSSIGNRSWKEKSLYYKHLSLTDDDQAKELHEKAILDGIELSEEIITRLTESTHASHMKPIQELPTTPTAWNHKFIELRSQRMCELLWDQILPWLD